MKKELLEKTANEMLGNSIIAESIKGKRKADAFRFGFECGAIAVVEYLAMLPLNEIVDELCEFYTGVRENIKDLS